MKINRKEINTIITIKFLKNWRDDIILLNSNSIKQALYATAKYTEKLQEDSPEITEIIFNFIGADIIKIKKQDDFKK